MLNQSTELQEKMEAKMKSLPCEIHAIYEPDVSEIFGDCYCAAIDLFSWKFTFRVYFKLDEAGNIDVRHIERWHFG